MVQYKYINLYNVQLDHIKLDKVGMSNTTSTTQAIVSFRPIYIKILRAIKL